MISEVTVKKNNLGGYFGNFDEILNRISSVYRYCINSAYIPWKYYFFNV